MRTKEIKEARRMCLCQQCGTIQKEGTKCGICNCIVIAKPIEKAKASIEFSEPVNAFYLDRKK